MVWKVTTPPGNEPITLDEAKSHLRVDSDERDDDIVGLIYAARQFAELTCNRALLTQIWLVTLPRFGCGAVPLPGGNVTEVNSVQYYDSNNVLQTLSTSKYFPMLTEPAKLEPDVQWPYTYCRPDAVQISVDVGYPNAADVPDAIKAALKLHVELLLDRPVGAEAAALERARDAILFPYIDGRLLT